MPPTVKTLDPNAPDTVEVSFDIPARSADPKEISQALTDLHRKLAEHWPVTSLTLLRKNPVNLAQWELTIAIGLATPLLKSLGEKLSDEAFKWLKSRFKGIRKHPTRKKVKAERTRIRKR